jgi:hypothetical protein
MTTLFIMKNSYHRESQIVPGICLQDYHITIIHIFAGSYDPGNRLYV